MKQNDLVQSNEITEKTTKDHALAPQAKPGVALVRNNTEVSFYATDST